MVFKLQGRNNFVTDKQMTDVHIKNNTSLELVVGRHNEYPEHVFLKKLEKYQ